MKYLTAAEVGDRYLRITPIAVADLCRTGKLRASKPDKQWLIKEDDVLAYLNANSNQSVGGAA